MATELENTIPEPDLPDNALIKRYKKLTNSAPIKYSLYDFSFPPKESGHVKLRPNQKEVLDEIKSQAIFLALPTGFGKTTMSVELIARLKLHTLILSPRNVITEQWVEAVNTYDVAEYCEIFTEMSFKNRREKYFATDFDIIIVDEVHMNEKLVFEDILPYFYPHYLITLTATPKEDSLYHPHFYKQKISRFQTRVLDAIPIHTNYKPIVYQKMWGDNITIDYSKTLMSVSHSVLRLWQISMWLMSYLALFPENGPILILAKFIYSIDQIAYLLESHDHKVSRFYKNVKTYDPNATFVIGTFSKIGVGFDGKDHFHTLVILDNPLKVMQPEGRLRNKGNIVILDFIDDHPMFYKHWKARAAWYRLRGGDIFEPEELPRSFYTDAQKTSLQRLDATENDDYL